MGSVRRIFQNLGVGALCGAALVAQAPQGFHPGPVIAEYGRVATVDGDFVIPEGAELRVAFDLSTGEPESLNRGLDTVARFLNLHAEAGVPLERLHPAVVVHGTAVFDVVSDDRYREHGGGDGNPNRKLVAALVGAGVEVYLCGQSAAARGIGKEDLLPGVVLAPSAMTVHALLQQRGYSLNPF